MSDTPTPDCWCMKCRPISLDDMRFVVCPSCGDKRCIHAKDHESPCAKDDIYAHNRLVEQRLAELRHDAEKRPIWQQEAERNLERVKKAEAERDELKGAISELRGSRLSEAMQATPLAAEFRLEPVSREWQEARLYRYLRDVAGQTPGDTDGPMICAGLGDRFRYLRGEECDEAVMAAIAARSAA